GRGERPCTTTRAPPVPPPTPPPRPPLPHATVWMPHWPEPETGRSLCGDALETSEHAPNAPEHSPSSCGWISSVWPRREDAPEACARSRGARHPGPSVTYRFGHRAVRWTWCADGDGCAGSATELAEHRARAAGDDRVHPEADAQVHVVGLVDGPRVHLVTGLFQPFDVRGLAAQDRDRGDPQAEAQVEVVGAVGGPRVHRAPGLLQPFDVRGVAAQDPDRGAREVDAHREPSVAQPGRDELPEVLRGQRRGRGAHRVQ